MAAAGPLGAAVPSTEEEEDVTGDDDDDDDVVCGADGDGVSGRTGAVVATIDSTGSPSMPVQSSLSLKADPRSFGSLPSLSLGGNKQTGQDGNKKGWGQRNSLVVTGNQPPCVKCTTVQQ